MANIKIYQCDNCNRAIFERDVIQLFGVMCDSPNKNREERELVANVCSDCYCKIKTLYEVYRRQQQ